MRFIVEGWKESEVVDNGPVELYIARHETDAIAWARKYVSTENAGGYDSVTVHQDPFEGDFCWSWDRN